MKKNKFVSILMGVQAIFIPFSLFAGLGSIISLANIGMVFKQSAWVAVTFVIETILICTYTVTYIISAFKSLSDNEISFVSFLPMIHFLLTVFFYVLCFITEQRYLI